MDLKERHDEIDAYLQRQMTPETEAAFEQEMAGNPDLEKEVRLMAWTNMTVDLAMEDDIRQTIEEVRNEETVVSPEPILFWQQSWFRWAAAAVLIGIVIIVALPYLRQPTPPPDEPTITRPQALNLIDLPSREGTLNDVAPEDVMKQAKDAFFEDEDYAKAEAGFKTVIAEGADAVKLEAKYLLGYAYFMQKKFQPAMEIFDSFIDDPEARAGLPERYGQNLEKLHWDGILAFYGAHEDDPKKVRTLVEEFIQTTSENYYRNKANQLLEKLAKD